MTSSLWYESQPQPARVSLRNHLASRLTRLMLALDQGSQVEQALHVAELLTLGWGDQPLLTTAPWPSDITDDHTPFELSIAFGRSSDTVRILTEPQCTAAAPSVQTSWLAASAVHDALRRSVNINFKSFSAVSDLFEPTAASTAPFAIWHSAAMDQMRGPQLKVYLNPAIHGADSAQPLLSAALSRLGLESAWARYAPRILRRTGLDACVFFALDMHDGPDARIKIYVAHERATSQELARVLSLAPGFSESVVRQWCVDLLGGEGPFERRSLLTCFAFTRSSLDLHSATLHLPVRSYLPDDFEIARRTSQRLNLPRRVRYMRALTAFCDRPLDAHTGLQSYVSMRASPALEAVTVYLAPELYSAAMNTPESQS